MILGSFFKALSQLGDPRFRGVLWRGILLALVFLILATAGFVLAVQAFVGGTVTLPLIGEVTWVDDVLSWGSFLLMLVLSVFLMMPVASAITSMFLDRVAEAVEHRHYPALPPGRAQPIWEATRDAFNFLGLMIAANLVALVFYLLLAPLAPLIFWGLNGYLLGREYFTLAAIRRLDREEANALRKRHGATIWAAGILMAIPLSVPVLNLVIPIVGAATFTHLYHALQNRASVGPAS